MLPEKYEPILFGFLLSGMMSLMVSGVSTLGALGFSTGFWGAWMGNWFPSWAIAFPTLLAVSPFVRRVVAKLIQKD